MALSELNWRYVGQINFVSGIANSHDAVYTLGTATTYADGTTRTPGSGSAWTWNRQQITGVTVAAYGVPPINALSMTYIVAGDTTTTAYPFVSPDTTGQANTVVYGMNRASGTFTSWVNAQPFTSGFSGYWRGCRAFSSVAYDNVAMWESEEGVVIVYSLNSTGVSSQINMGALFDPLSNAALDAESDGRRYFMGGTGSGSTIPNNHWSTYVGSFADGVPMSHYSLSAGSHFATFTTGATTLIPANRFFACAPNNTLTTLSGNVARIPWVAVHNTTQQFIGQSRQMFIVKDAVSKQAWMDGATAIGYVIASNSTTQSDSCLLLY